MRSILNNLDHWLFEGKRIALATVTATWGSSPRPAGSVMAFTSEGDMAGSVSGGCVEGAVAQAALEVIESNQAELLPFTATYQAAWDVGLACGGQIEVLVQPFDLTRFEVERRAILEDRGYSRLMLTVCSEGRPLGGTLLLDGDDIFFSDFDKSLSKRIAEAFARIPFTEVAGCFKLEDDVQILSFSFARQRTRPQLICIGATHVAIALTHMARAIGFATAVIDPRSIFSSKDRFPHVDILLHEWPQEAMKKLSITSETAICVLTHDPKIDLPALEQVVYSPAFYIGSLGRSSTQRHRCRELRELGVPDELIARVYGPIGLDLGGKLPEEIALAILSEITAVRYGHSASSSRMASFAEPPVENREALSA
jgi:xanthine dehydrogenase accessory factor